MEYKSYIIWDINLYFTEVTLWVGLFDLNNNFIYCVSFLVDEIYYIF